jgi:hypothetical protein
MSDTGLCKRKLSPMLHKKYIEIRQIRLIPIYFETLGLSVFNYQLNGFFAVPAIVSQAIENMVIMFGLWCFGINIELDGGQNTI